MYNLLLRPPLQKKQIYIMSVLLINLVCFIKCDINKINNSNTYSLFQVATLTDYRQRHVQKQHRLRLAYKSNILSIRGYS